MISIEQIRQKCWDRALEAYGTGHIFEQRAICFRRRLRILTFLGIAVPATIGSIVLSFEKFLLLPYLIGIAGILLSLQLIGSIWSLVARWDDSYAYALESLTANHRLSSSYQRLAENPSSELADFQLRFDLLEKEDQLRSTEDYKQGITEEEKRAGMRAALRRFRRPCAACEEVPVSMDPSNCEVCGNFRRRIL